MKYLVLIALSFFIGSLNGANWVIERLNEIDKDNKK